MLFVMKSDFGINSSNKRGYGLNQGSSNLSLKVQSAAGFSSNPDKITYLWFSNDLEDSD